MATSSPSALRPVTVRTTSAAYPAIVGPGAVDSLALWLEMAGLQTRARVIADETVWHLYGRQISAAIESAELESRVMTIPSGEERKSFSEAERLFDWLIDVGTDRGDFVVAVGGGVVGDLAGFAAATFLRGIGLVHVPTTLLAQVDSSIGGKVAVNHRLGKNLIGAFHQPSLVVSDTELLRGLPSREYRAGWAEIVKIAMIADGDLFAQLERHAEALLRFEQPTVLGEVIRRAVELKAEVVGEDERESGRRIILNYGHTVGHALEAATQYGRFLHGEAVAIGMAAAGAIANRRGVLPDAALSAQGNVLARFGLPSRVDQPVPIADLIGPLARDKKARGNTIQWVFADRIGGVTTARDVEPEEVTLGLRYVGCT